MGFLMANQTCSISSEAWQKMQARSKIRRESHQGLPQEDFGPRVRKINKNHKKANKTKKELQIHSSSVVFPYFALVFPGPCDPLI